MSKWNKYFFKNSSEWIINTVVFILIVVVMITHYIGWIEC